VKEEKIAAKNRYGAELFLFLGTEIFVERAGVERDFRNESVQKNRKMAE